MAAVVSSSNLHSSCFVCLFWEKGAVACGRGGEGRAVDQDHAWLHLLCTVEWSGGEILLLRRGSSTEIIVWKLESELMTASFACSDVFVIRRGSNRRAQVQEKLAPAASCHATPTPTHVQTKRKNQSYCAAT